MLGIFLYNLTSKDKYDKIKTMKNDLTKIKKLYGEDFAKKFCRAHFAHIMEREDFSFAEFLTTIVFPSKFFYEDLKKHNQEENFKNILNGMFNEDRVEIVDIEETPEELMKKKGYKLYRCETNEDILKFKKYYAPNEVLCTFGDEDRIKKNTIFWAVKENVDEIKRFKHPEREDDYGTSVISIQFSKGKHSTLSIKNRYNHTVDYCDATFSNNLDNICEGLTDSFKKFYGIDLKMGISKLRLPGYVMDNNGTYHKYNHEINNIYYCADNCIIENGHCKHYKPSRYLVADYFIIDSQTKTVDLLPSSNIADYFTTQFYAVEKIEYEKGEDGGKVVNIYQNDGNLIKIEVNKYNQMIKFSNSNLVDAGNMFLSHNKAIVELDVPNLQYVRDYFMNSNLNLRHLNVPKVEEFGTFCLSSNIALKTLNIKNTISIGHSFLTTNEVLSEINAKNLTEVGVDFLYSNLQLQSLNLPRLKKIAEGFLKKNKTITRFYAPKLDKNDPKLTNQLAHAYKEPLLKRFVNKLSKEDELQV